MSREERERRRHILHWTQFMIHHLEGRDEDPGHYSYEEALQQLRVLIDRELEAVHVQS